MKESELIARFIFFETPFDECAGVDIHEQAAAYAAPEEPDMWDYYEAFLDCCRAALESK